jgi:hypothetical protein
VRGSPALINLDGLHSLTTVDELSLENNAALADLDGLRALEAASTITVKGNSALSNLDGLSNAEIGAVHLEANAKLANLDGLRRVTEPKYVELAANALPNLEGLSGLTRTERLSVRDEWQLKTLDGPSNLIEVGSLYIESNPSLVSLHGLDALESAHGHVYIRHNHALSTCEAEWLLNSIEPNTFDSKINGNADAGVCP